MSAAEHDDRIAAYLALPGADADPPLLGVVVDGHPFGGPCVAEWAGDGEFRLTTRWPRLRPSDPARGASLLWHYHDAALEEQHSMLLLGWLRAEGDGLVFRISRPPDITGLDAVDQAELFRTFDRNADKYLTDHGLDAPVVDQAAFEALVAEVRAETISTSGGQKNNVG